MSDVEAGFESEKSGSSLAAKNFQLDLCSERFNQMSKLATQSGNAGQSEIREQGVNSSNDVIEFCSAFVAAERPQVLPRKGTDFWGESPDPNDLHTGRRALGGAIMEKLGDWDWLIANRKALQRGLETAYGKMTPDAFEKFIKELGDKSGGKIYMEKGNGLLGSLNPINPPGSLVVRCYLKRGGLYTDDKLMDSRNLTYSPTYSSGGRTYDSNK